MRQSTCARAVSRGLEGCPRATVHADDVIRGYNSLMRAPYLRDSGIYGRFIYERKRAAAGRLHAFRETELERERMLKRDCIGRGVEGQLEGCRRERAVGRRVCPLYAFINCRARLSCRAGK